MGIVEESLSAWEGSTLSTEEILASIVTEWEASEARRDMQDGVRYYKVKNDIADRVMWQYDEAGNRSKDEAATNHKVAHGFMRLAVDEKIAYLLGKTPAYSAEKLPALEDALTTHLAGHFSDKLIDYAAAASKCGIAWIHPYIVAVPGASAVGGQSALRFMVPPSDQIIPLWADDDHETLQAVIRTYFVAEYQGKEKVSIRKVEVWDAETVMCYTEDDGKLIADIAAEESGEPVPHMRRGDKAYSWGFVPFLPLKNNSDEQPDHKGVKAGIDAYDLLVSDGVNTLDDIAALILVLKNFDGQDVAEFRRNLKLHKVVKVSDGGGVDALAPAMDVDALKAMLDRLKADFYQFAQSVDMSSEKFGSAPSGVALEFMYSGLKLKCDTLERKLQSAFGGIFAAVCRYVEVTGGKRLDPSAAKVTFTRSTISNINDALAAVETASATHSMQTVLAHSPWVEDVAAEMDMRKAEQADPYGDFTAGA